MSDRVSPRAAVIAGVGSWLPPDVVTNHDLSQRLDTSDEWIRKRTGIAERRVVSPGMAASDLAVEASQRALRSAGASQVDAVVLATTTPDQPCPATAPGVAARLGLRGVPAFDISAVCTGFLYALAAAAGLIATGTADRVLVIASEVYSTILNPNDRSTAVIFGDGAGAVVLRAGTESEPGALGPVVLGSDGEFSHLIQIPAGGSRQRSSGVPPLPGDEFFQMAGKEVFRHAVDRMTAVCREATEAAGWEADLVDRLAAHQANRRITTAVAEELGLSAEQQLSNIERVGNTGAASLPLLLAHSVEQGRLLPGHRVLLTAFGGGLTWGATTLTWPRLHTA
ncbi:beta-ketoacyl-ACP synthase III [Streptomyces sp. NPDC005065]|uniref:beta-ketoacyl-ACP synthase III n=1 Tax=unclassified Streptomyces TaxID=2593676 RepID=UPI0033A9829B